MTETLHPPGPRTGPAGRGFAALAVAALGIVYGDIGTSPLYAVRECFHGMHSVAVTHGNVLGVLSLVFWSLAMVVSAKYVLFILRVDNKGEGGIFALMAMLPKTGKGFSPGLKRAVMLAGVFGAALLYGDGVITPSISILSAVEGLEVAAPAARSLVVPATCCILVLLFSVQRRGTASIGKVFGVVMLVWFSAIAVLGVRAVAGAPQVLAAVNPAWAVRFFLENHLHGMVVLGSVVLCITGAEALYADLGHFNRATIRLSWTLIVWPSLVCNYFGQGALLLKAPHLSANPFYALAPRPLLYPMVVLATVATIIASQAMISGMYSLTHQAVQLGLLPRVRTLHTSREAKGQIYIPMVNGLLLLACLSLVLAARSSSRLSGAYGLAVTSTMAITSVVYFFVLTRTFHRPVYRAALLVGLFLVFDLTYFAANLWKIVDGGWFTLAVAVALWAVMTSWKQGRRTLFQSLSKTRVPEDAFLKEVESHKPVRTPGIAVFLSVSPTGVPIAVLHHYKFTRSLPERVVFLSLTTAEAPYVADKERLAIRDLGQGFTRIVAVFGFMEAPSVPKVLALAEKQGLVIPVNEAAYYLSRETLVITGKTAMAPWRKKLFAFLSRNSQTPMSYFDLPPHRVVELGMQMEL